MKIKLYFDNTQTGHPVYILIFGESLYNWTYICECKNESFNPMYDKPEKLLGLIDYEE